MDRENQQNLQHWRNVIANDPVLRTLNPEAVLPPPPQDAVVALHESNLACTFLDLPGEFDDLDDPILCGIRTTLSLFSLEFLA